MNADNQPQLNDPLWTRDCTIVTIGTVVSMFGNAMSGFAMSLIYTLDFISAGLCLIAAIIMSTGWFSFPVSAVLYKGTGIARL